jgi:uncharacterized protein (TIGR02271 family)
MRVPRNRSVPAGIAIAGLLPMDKGNPRVTREPRVSVDPAVEERGVHDKTVIPVLQEELDVSTRRVATESGVRIDKHVDEREEIVDEPLSKDELEVERVTINRPVDGPVAVRHEGDTMIVPVLEEVLVVEKRLILKEELRITRRRTEYRSPQRVTLRSEHVDVERIGDPGFHGSPAAAVPPRVEADVDSRPEERRRADMDADAHPGQRRQARTDADSLLEEKRRQDEELRRNVTPPIDRVRRG